MIENIWQIVIYILGFGICFIALILSMVTISGTWLVLFAGLLFKLTNVSLNPSWMLIFMLLIMAASVEVCEALAGYFGVLKKGGSKFAGFIASVTSFIGGVIGTFVIPIYIVGSLVGLIAGGFLGAYTVEYFRLKQSNKAIDIAMGTVFAKVFILVLKVVVTLIMTLMLLLS